MKPELLAEIIDLLEIAVDDYKHGMDMPGQWFDKAKELLKMIKEEK